LSDEKYDPYSKFQIKDTTKKPKQLSQDMVDFRQPRTFAWIASGKNRKWYNWIMNDPRKRARIIELCKALRVRHDAKRLATFIANSIRNKKEDYLRAFFGSWYSEELIHEIRRAKQQDTPIILVIVGDLAGGGKSFGGVKIALTIDPFFGPDQIFMNEIEFTMYCDRDQLEWDRVYMFDDPDNSNTGTGVRARKERLERVIRQAARFANTDFIFCSAIKLRSTDLDFDNVLFYLESIGKNKKENLAYFMVYDRDKNALGIARIYNPEVDHKKVITEYLKKKKAFVERIIEAGGRQSTAWVGQAVEYIVQHEEFEGCRNYRGDLSISTLKGLINDILPDSKGSIAQIAQKIIRLDRIGKITGSKALETQVSFYKEKGGSFYFAEDLFLEKLELNPKWTETVACYRLWTKVGLSQDQIADQKGVEQPTVSKWFKALKGIMSKEIGAQYEQYLMKQIEKDPDVEEIKHDGRKGQPDLIVFKEDGSIDVISVKCQNSHRTVSTLQIEDLGPEISACNYFRSKGKEVRLILDFYNHHTKQHIQEQIDLDDLPSNISVTLKKKARH
jgi:hypothetical protein